ncbi:EAL domain-containing protein [Granulosicoccus sp. 3-233]|uniref:EAL domain-containing protein n=1 Tax=Granulosicoccus sp. 3-233 TaxID=3417969 RepID=UPI003D350614
MLMEEELQRDPQTGLLRRAAFLAEVRKSRTDGVSQVRRGCLLILHFPVLRQIQEAAGGEASGIAMMNLLGIVETRHRSRDTMGRLGDHSLCIFLRRCKEEDAMLIAEQYVALLRDVILEAGETRASMDLHYRIVPLDWRGRRSRQGVSKMVKSPDDAARVVSAIKTLACTGGPGLGQLVHLSPPHRPPSTVASAAGTTGAEAVTLAASGYRLLPGMLMQHRPLVCCYRVRPLGVFTAAGALSASPLISAVLDTLALGAEQARPVIESQLIVPVEAAQLNSESARWLKSECRERRVAPSDVCLSLHVDSLTRDLRASLPAIRSLNRQGIMLMLEGVSSAAQFKAIRHLAGFDYLLISPKDLQASLLQIRARQELESLLVMAREQQRQVCAAGIDTPALLAHAQVLNVDIGFGRRCGRSEPFPIAVHT